jgi:hypothetical protein
MRGSKQDLPVMVDEAGIRMQQGEWGTMLAHMEIAPAGLDNAPLLKGLPNDQCQCPHWGYMIKGRMRVTYTDSDEVITAGDAYYIAPGHSVAIEEDAELVEFSPKDEVQKSMEVIMRNWEAQKQAAGSSDQ